MTQHIIIYAVDEMICIALFLTGSALTGLTGCQDSQRFPCQEQQWQCDGICINPITLPDISIKANTAIFPALLLNPVKTGIIILGADVSLLCWVALSPVQPGVGALTRLQVPALVILVPIFYRIISYQSSPVSKFYAILKKGTVQKWIVPFMYAYYSF